MKKKTVLKDAGVLLIVLVMVLSTVMIVAGNSQSPPNKPSSPSGPTEGYVGVEYTFCTSTTDPDGDDLYYLFDWGDGTFSYWIGPYASGEEASASHTWTEKGIYEIRAKAKDIHGVQSPWSDPFIITIVESDPPGAPVITGTTNGGAGTSYDYGFTSTDPNGDNISYYVDWGDDTTTGWTDYVASGTEITLTHTWDEQGTYIVKAKAKDVYGAESDWAYLEVEMPVNQPQSRQSNQLLQKILQQFPNAFPILGQLLEL